MNVFSPILMIFQPLGFSNGGYINPPIVVNGGWNPRVEKISHSHVAVLGMQPDRLTHQKKIAESVSSCGRVATSFACKRVPDRSTMALDRNLPGKTSKPTF